MGPYLSYPFEDSRGLLWIGGGFSAGRPIACGYWDGEPSADPAVGGEPQVAVVVFGDVLGPETGQVVGGGVGAPGAVQGHGWL